MIGSYILSRTLVPTLANYLLASQKYHPEPDTEEAMHHPDPAPAATIRSCASSVASSRPGFEKVRESYREMLELAMRRRTGSPSASSPWYSSHFVLAPFLGQNFFPTIDAGEIKLHVRAQPGTRIEETSSLCDRIESAVRHMIPAADLDRIVDNIGLSASGVNLAYGNSGSIGAQDADILISLKKDRHGRHRAARRCDARAPAPAFSRDDVLLPAPPTSSRKFSLRTARAGGRAGDRQQDRRQSRVRAEGAQAHRPGSGRGRRPHTNKSSIRQR